MVKALVNTVAASHLSMGCFDHWLHLQQGRLSSGWPSLLLMLQIWRESWELAGTMMSELEPRRRLHRAGEEPRLRRSE